MVAMNYDAVHILTMGDSEVCRELLYAVRETILSEQNGDGSFAENKAIDGGSFVIKAVSEIITAQQPFRMEKLKRTISVMRPKIEECTHIGPSIQDVGTRATYGILV